MKSVSLLSCTSLLFSTSIIFVAGNAGSQDWLGRCYNGSGGTSSPEQHTPQVCSSIGPCDNVQDGCNSPQNKTCDNLTMTAWQQRASDYGDCVAASSGSCYDCAGGMLICYVLYDFESNINGTCTNRCSVPASYKTYKEYTGGTGLKCKP
jgi:hypothetical protein